jgi:hypothetical protein
MGIPPAGSIPQKSLNRVKVRGTRGFDPLGVRPDLGDLKKERRCRRHLDQANGQ